MAMPYALVTAIIRFKDTHLNDNVLLRTTRFSVTKNHNEIRVFVETIQVER